MVRRRRAWCIFHVLLGFFFLFLTRGLHLLEFGSVFVAHTAEAVFLEAQVLELAFVLQIDSQLELVGWELVGEFHLSDGVDGGFETECDGDGIRHE